MTPLTDTSLHCATATALACTNAVIQYMRLGLFVSEVRIGYPVRISAEEESLKLGCSIDGRTNKEEGVRVLVHLLYAKSPAKRFPIAEACVWVSYADDGKFTDRALHVCRFVDNCIAITKT